jgi:hypothetical protein
MLMSRNLISTFFVSLDEVEWSNSTLVEGDVPAAVAALKQQPDGEKHALELVDSRTFGTGVVYATYTPQASPGGS